LFTIDDCFSPEEFNKLSEVQKKHVHIKIDNFIKNCRQPDGNYILFCEEDYIVLQKGTLNG
jgi:hypothetical protein